MFSNLTYLGLGGEKIILEKSLNDEILEILFLGILKLYKWTKLSFLVENLISGGFGKQHPCMVIDG